MSKSLSRGEGLFSDFLVGLSVAASGFSSVELGTTYCIVSSAWSHGVLKTSSYPSISAHCMIIDEVRACGT